MAKTRKKARTARTTAAGLDRSLAQVKSRLVKWRAERDALAAHLRGVIRTGETMLAELGDEAATAARGSGAGRKAKRGKRRLSPEGRARIIAAAKKRWAQYRKDKEKGKT